jgi:RNA polymerase sigma-70 factor, ECF subfamily
MVGLNDLSDLELVERARGGERDALDRLLRRHQPRILSVCRRLTGNDADGADAAQEALIAMVKGLHRFDGRSSFGTWAYRVATNSSLDELRRRKRRAAESIDATNWDEPSVSSRTSDVDERDALEAALRTLPEEFRVAVVLRDVADLDYSEISEVLGIPAGTVKSRIARGRAQLAQQLGNQIDPSERPNFGPES